MAHDVIVAGSGPGGSAAAAFLARAGRDVLLLDKHAFPRDKPCGDAISGKSVGVLQELGVVDAVEAAPHALALGVRFTSPDGDELVVPFPKQYHADGAKGRRYPYVAPGYVSRREVFDNVVHEAAVKAGAQFETGEVAGLLRRSGGVAGVRLKDGREIIARAVVGADGALSAVARDVGAFDNDPDHWVAALREYWVGVEGVDENIEIHFTDGVLPGYFWIFPLDNGMANVGVGILGSEIRRRGLNLNQLEDHLTKDHPVFGGRFANATFVEGSRRAWNLPLGSKRRRAHGDGWLLVGDAAGLIDPFSGEGIGNALVSGRLAAHVLNQALEAGDLSAARLNEYQRLLWNELGAEMRASYKLQRLGRFRWLLNFVIRRAATRPHVGEMLSDMLADRQKQVELSRLGFYLRLLLG